MSPEPTEMTLGSKLAAELKYESISTRKMLERIPPDVFAWKPHEKSTEIGHLAHHIARLPSFVKPIMTSNEFDMASSGQPPPDLHSVEELVNSFDTSLAEAIEHLNNASMEDLTPTWKLKSGDHTLFEMPRIGVVRSLVLSHLIHHRGQLSVYLRLRDIPVPSIYGPSADEQQT